MPSFGVPRNRLLFLTDRGVFLTCAVVVRASVPDDGFVHHHLLSLLLPWLEELLRIIFRFSNLFIWILLTIIVYLYIIFAIGTCHQRVAAS